MKYTWRLLVLSIWVSSVFIADSPPAPARMSSAYFTSIGELEVYYK